MTRKPKELDRWPQRMRFVELLDEWLKVPGHSIQEFARQVGRSESMIYSYRTRPDSRPTFNLAQRFSQVLQCDMGELWPMPDAISGEAAVDLTEHEQFLLGHLVRKFKDPALCTRDRELLAEDWLRGFDRLIILKTAISSMERS